MLINSVMLEIRESDVPIRGNAMVSGNSKYDRKVENEIIERLDSGDIYAWFDAKVTVSIEVNGITFEGYDILGACSYTFLTQFLESSGYYDDMVQTALDNALSELREYVEAFHGTLNESEVKALDLSGIKPVVMVY